MRILFINNTHSVIGGADRVYLNTGKLMEEKGHEVFYFSTLGKDDEPTPYSKYFIRVNRMRESGMLTKLKGVKDYVYNRHAYQNLRALIQEYKPDIAHIHLFCGGVTTAVLKALHDSHIPVVQTVHDYRLLCPANAFLDARSEICEKCRNQVYLQCALKRCVDGNFFYSSMVAMDAYFRKIFINPLDLIQHFIFVSKFAMDKHIQFNGQYAGKSSHLFNFTNLPALKPGGHRGDYFLFFGRISVEKGLITLVNAAIATGIKLKIVGAGPLDQEVRQLIKGHSNLQFIGHLSGSALQDTIMQASYIIVPSEWYENNPMTVLEAYALGKPVMGSRIGGIPEIIIDNETGYLFEPRTQKELEKTLIKALEVSDPEYSRQSDNAWKFASQFFSQSSHYEHLMKIYSSLSKHVE